MIAKVDECILNYGNNAAPSNTRGLLMFPVHRAHRQDPSQTSSEFTFALKSTLRTSNGRVHLKPDQFAVCWNKATEPPFGEYNDCKDKGIYGCICCENNLFSSATKYDSGTEWPSFYAPIKVDSVKTIKDKSLDTIGKEVVCGNCGAHLGHVYDVVD